jgi:mRNA-degrading endonuclease RelE of RelBE toxin-antitoxin system
MSATEIIEQIKKLPRQEQEQVFAFLKRLDDSETLHDEPGVHYMDFKKAKAVSAEIFSEHAGLFRKLAG